MATPMTSRESPPATWTSYRQALEMFLRGATLSSASRIALVVGTWLALINHGERLVHGEIPWIKIVLDYATPFVVSSLGFLAARRHSNVERLVRLLDDRSPKPS